MTNPRIWIEQTVAAMSEEDRAHWEAVQCALLSCYVDNTYHGVIIVCSDDPETPEHIELAQMMSINATDIVSAKIVAHGATQVTSLLMADAPPREMFN